MCCTKFELLVACRRSEVLPFDLAIVANLTSVVSDHRDRGLAAEGRVGQDDGPPLPRVGAERVAHVDERVSVVAAHAVQEQIHRGEARRPVDKFVATDEVVLELVALEGIHPGDVARHMVVRDEEEPAGAARGVDHRVGDGRIDCVHDRLDEGAWSEVLTGSGPLVRGALGEEAFVGVTVDVGAGL